MLKISSPKAQPITADISPKRHQSLSSSLLSPWRKLITVSVHQLFWILQRITDVPSSLKGGIIIPVLQTGEPELTEVKGLGKGHAVI